MALSKYSRMWGGRKKIKKKKDEKPENYPETFTLFMIHLFETSDQIKTYQKGEG